MYKMDNTGTESLFQTQDWDVDNSDLDDDERDKMRRLEATQSSKRTAARMQKKRKRGPPGHPSTMTIKPKAELEAELHKKRNQVRARIDAAWMNWYDFKKTVLVPAFRILRSQKIYARTTRLLCCGNCTVAELDDVADEFVGFHIQNVPDKRKARFEELFLIHRLKPSSVTFVRNTFLDLGMAVHWDGDDNLTIHLRRFKMPGTLWRKVRAHVRARGIFWFWYGAALANKYKEDSAGRKRDIDELCEADWNAPDGSSNAATGPPGVTDEFDNLHMTLSVEFLPLPKAEKKELVDSGAYRTVYPTDDCDKSFCEHLERYYNGAEPIASLSNPERFDDEKDEFVELKGAELDAIAFRGSEIHMQVHDAYDTVPETWMEFNAPNKKYFTIAELHLALQQYIERRVWHQQVIERSFSLDHIFFQGLVPYSHGYRISWGS